MIILLSNFIKKQGLFITKKREVVILKHALTIAGSDSGGGAGIQADLKTFSALGVYGMSVITSVTAQNTMGVEQIEDLSPEIVKAQLDAVYSDIRIDAVKIGMVSRIEVIKAISSALKEYDEKRVVLDPVMVSESGHSLLKEDARETLINELIPRALVVTPNIYGGEQVLEPEINTILDMKQAATDIVQLGPDNVVVKGGHLDGNAVDVYYDGDDFTLLEAERIDTQNTHGTGCTFSSAIASYLAGDNSLNKSVKKAKEFITAAIKNAPDIGQGAGPTNHFHQFS